MQPQSESTQPTLQMKMRALARAGALESALRRIWQSEMAVKAVRAARVKAVRAVRAGAEVQAEVGKSVQELRELWRRELREMRLDESEESQQWQESRESYESQGSLESLALTYGEVLADSILMDIIYSIEPDHRHRLSRYLWRKPERWWWLIQIIAPITRLPQELLQRIVLIIIDNASHSPLALMRVSKLWYTIVTGIWGSIKLGTTTPRDAVTRQLERSQRFLNVVIDTDIDRGDPTPSEGPYQAILAAIQAAPRWRSLVVETFPAQTDLPEHLVNRGVQQCLDIVMSRLVTFKIKCPCEMSPLLQRLLLLLGTAASGELTTVEINSTSVMSFLAPTYPSIFHSVKVLCLDTPQLPDPVDLLPHLHQLEELTASHLSLPVYPNDVDIPFVHTLRHLSLRAVSIQWMSGRTFHAIESCTLLNPLYHHVLQTFSATLPNCNDLTFQGYPLDILNGISAHNLTRLTVKSSCFEKLRGSRQLVRFSNRALRENRISPRILHISIEATNRVWIKAFTFLSNLEELVIDNAHPSSLGVKALQALVVQSDQANNMGTTATQGGQYTPLCPSLKQFELRYRRWLRPSEHFDLIPGLLAIILSRQQSKFSLRSFLIWKESGQKEPLELIEKTWISLKTIEGLTNNDAFKGENLLRLVASTLMGEVPKS